MSDPAKTVLTSPQAVARTIAAAIRRAANPLVARRLRRFFKPGAPVRFYGVPAPRLRTIVRAATVDLSRVWRLEEAAACCEWLLAQPAVECRLAGVEVLRRFRRRFKPWLLGRAERWIRRGRADNWAVLDALALFVVAPLLGQHPEGLVRVARWARARSRWVRRGAAVALVPLARSGRALARAYAVADALLPTDDDLLQKAVGWLLREAGRHDRRRLQRFLRARAATLPRTTLRYAVEHWPAAERRRWLERTRRLAEAVDARRAHAATRRAPRTVPRPNHEGRHRSQGSMV